jgi:GT2 family glycosyltransferase
VAEKAVEAAQPAVSIVIVTWNGKGYALECLSSLRNHGTSAVIETIVVDNASTDGTSEAIRQLFPTVKLIQNKSNFGFAKANNIGMILTKGKYLCLINSDVTIPPGCLAKMSAYMEQNPDVGILGPKMLSPDGAVGHSVMRLPTVWNTLCCALGLHLIFNNSRTLGGFLMSGFCYDGIEDVEVLTGWFWMVRQCALEEVGPLDEQFFMYGEDIDWCHRFRRAGWRVVFYPGAEALHLGAASSDKEPMRFYVEMRRANLQYFRKHHGWYGWFGFLVATWLHELVRIAAYAALLLFKTTDRQEASCKIERSLACLGWLAGVKSVSEGK